MLSKNLKINKTQFWTSSAVVKILTVFELDLIIEIPSDTTA